MEKETKCGIELGYDVCDNINCKRGEKAEQAMEKETLKLNDIVYICCAKKGCCNPKANNPNIDYCGEHY